MSLFSRVELADVLGLADSYQSSLESDDDSSLVDPPSREVSRRSSSQSRSRRSPVARLALVGTDRGLSHVQDPLLAESLALPSNERLHPLLSPLGSPDSVVIDMVAHLAPQERALWIAARWAHAQPEDVFVHTFSFLTPAELARVSSVNRSWSHAAYEPSLWTHMDLSSMYTRVDDAFVTHLLGSRRFVHLRTLILEGCSAITNKSVKSILYFCPNLRELRLTACHHITNPWAIVELVKALPYLRTLEIFGVTKEFGIVPPILTHRPRIDLGLFWREYCAENGLKLDGGGLANCRYDEGAEDGPAMPAAGGAGGRGCWGRVQGRIVYANDFYHRGGNYPLDVLYSCRNHAEQDFADPDYLRCHVCECLFSVSGHSMWTDLICRVCFDETNLHSRKSWIPLDASSVKEFGLSEVVTKTIHVASRKNLPVSLRSFGATPARLDYTLPDPPPRDLEDEEKEALVSHRIDPTDVPMSVFVGVNGWRVDETVHAIRGKLASAQSALNTRALLVYDANENIEVLADKRVILDGKEGEEHMQLTVQAWHQALEILYPILIVMVLSMHFCVLFVKQTQTTYNGVTDYTAYITSSGSDGLSSTMVLLIALIGVVLLVGCIYLVYRFREQCERCFKRFLVGDILLIFMFGVATMLWLIVAEWRIYLDTITFVGLIWNLSMIGLLSLYYPMPERVHHFFLVLLNSIMAIMMVWTIGQWLVLTFLLLFSIGDVLSELRPNMRLLSPFLIPTNVELIYNTPKVLYTIGSLRLRAADLMCFGMLTGLGVATGNGTADYPTVLLGGSFVFVAALGAMAIMLFVAPFIGCRVRPMPIAVVIAFVCTIMEEAVIMPYVRQQNSLIFSPIAF